MKAIQNQVEFRRLCEYRGRRALRQRFVRFPREGRIYKFVERICRLGKARSFSCEVDSRGGGSRYDFILADDAEYTSE